MDIQAPAEAANGLDYLSYGFGIASYLTDPICKSHEYFRRISVVDSLHPDGNRAMNFVRKLFFGAGVPFFAVTGFLPAMAGIAIRKALCSLQTQPFIHLKGNLNKIKKEHDGTFSTFFWNIGTPMAGYVITDANQMPWPFRIEKIIKKIREQDADIVALAEVFDIKTAFRLYAGLKDEYPFFYLNIGPRHLGVSSGLFVASRFEVTDPQFVPFPKEMLVDRTKNAEKGSFSVLIKSSGKVFAQVLVEHLQHSEEPQFPRTDPKCNEVKARKDEIEKVVIPHIKNGMATVVVGDLNCDEKEFNTSSWESRFDRGEYPKEPTWAGDAFCASLTRGKKISRPLTLDYAMIVKGTAKGIRTELITTGHDAKKFDSGLSDHAGLRSVIRV